MLGFISAVGAEIASGETVGAQFADAPLPILAGAALFIAASFVPILKKTPTEAFGPFTPCEFLLLRFAPSCAADGC